MSAMAKGEDYAPAGRAIARSRSLDHLVGAGEQRRRNFQIKRPSYLKIDDQLKFGRLHDRQIGGLCSFEDASGVVAHLTPCDGKISSIAHQPTGLGILACAIDDGNSVAGSRRDD